MTKGQKHLQNMIFIKFRNTSEFGSFEFWSFDIVSSFVFRASNFFNQMVVLSTTPMGCFLKAPSSWRGFFTLGAVDSHLFQIIP